MRDAPLTSRQKAAVKSAQARWLAWIFSTRPANREQTEEGVRRTYRAGGVEEPVIFLWFDDLMEAMLATEQLSSHRESNWMLPPGALRRRDGVQRLVRSKLGLRTWKQVVQAVGPWHSPNRYEEKRQKGMRFMAATPRQDSLQAGLRTSADDRPTDYHAIEKAAAAVGRVAVASYSELERIVDRAAGPGIPGHGGISSLPTIYQDYPLDLLYRHDCLLRICGQRASAIYDGLRLTVEHCGPWWAFANAAILCDRPRIAHRDSEARLHNDSGPVVIFRNGVELFARHGSGMPEEAIRCPESRKRPEIRAEDDLKVRAALIEIYGAERYEREGRPPRPRKQRNPLAIVLPDAPEEKIDVLRRYGPLPYYERYLSGEHRRVWRELGGLGARVREDHYAADALAVAYTTMVRARQNIATIIERLHGIRYEFEAESGNRDKVIPYGVARWNLRMNVAPERPTPFRPPELGRANLRRLEKDAGELPISLRAWYEVVGSVTLLGKHPALSPGDGTVLPDPLVIVPFSQILRDWDNSPPDVGVAGAAFVAEIGKPHSKGRSYQITLPSIGMDAPLENEIHGLLFVDYLRLAFQWGGFPGFKGADQPPKEIELLKDGLLPI